jgi:hydrogenase maturation protease
MRIICCGNPDRGDDGVGPLVAGRLRDFGVEAEIRSGEALDLIEAWSGADNVVVVDAVQTDASLGTVHLWDGQKASYPADESVSTHGLGVASAIRIARVLGRLPERLQVYGIEGRRFEPGTEVSPELRRVVEHVVRQINAARTEAKLTAQPICPHHRRRMQQWM